jgi:hypothetical protein
VEFVTVDIPNSKNHHQISFGVSKDIVGVSDCSLVGIEILFVWINF